MIDKRLEHLWDEKGLTEMGQFSLEMTEGTAAMCINIERGCQEDGSRLCSVVPSSRTGTGQKLLHGNFHLNMRKNFGVQCPALEQPVRRHCGVSLAPELSWHKAAPCVLGWRCCSSEAGPAVIPLGVSEAVRPWGLPRGGQSAATGARQHRALTWDSSQSGAACPARSSSRGRGSGCSRSAGTGPRHSRERAWQSRERACPRSPARLPAGGVAMATGRAVTAPAHAQGAR